MDKSTEIQIDQRKAADARPFILSQLRSNVELLSISARVAADYEVDDKKAYRWVLYISEDFTAKKRRVVRTGLLLVWVGTLAALVGAALTVFGVATDLAQWWAFGLLIGVPLVIAGAVVIRRAGHLTRLSV